MAQDKERLIPFSEETFNQVMAEKEKSRRHFKHEAAILIEEALAARAENKAAASNG